MPQNSICSLFHPDHSLTIPASLKWSYPPHLIAREETSATAPAHNDFFVLINKTLSLC